MFHVHKSVNTSSSVLYFSKLVPQSCFYTTRFTHPKELSNLNGHSARYLNSVVVQFIVLRNKFTVVCSCMIYF